MELDVLIMPHIAKMEFSIYPDYWKDEMKRIKAFLFQMIFIQWGPLYLIKKLLVWVKLII